MGVVLLKTTGPRATIEDAASWIEDAASELGAAVALVEHDDDEAVWDLCLYVEAEREQALRDALRTLDVSFSRQALDEADWVARSLDELGPVRAGGFVVHGAHDRDQLGHSRTAIEIEAGLAFGSGHHGTTAGCLVAIDRTLRRLRPRRMLDLGTGSGVLAIALAKRGRRPVMAVDIDPVAARVARSNAILNGVGPWVRPVVRDGLDARVASAGPYDLIVANILANPLAAMATRISGSLAPGGTLVLSGLLDRQARRIEATYRARDLVRQSRVSLEGWTTLTLRRPRPGGR